MRNKFKASRSYFYIPHSLGSTSIAVEKAKSVCVSLKTNSSSFLFFFCSSYLNVINPICIVVGKIWHGFL